MKDVINIMRSLKFDTFVFEGMEAYRRNEYQLANDLLDKALLMNKDNQSKVNLLASGGVTTPLDVVKLLILGAQAVGISGYFLKAAQKDESVMMEEIENFLHEFKLIMLMLGCESIEDLRTCDIQLLDRLYDRYEK